MSAFTEVAKKFISCAYGNLEEKGGRRRETTVSFVARFRCNMQLDRWSWTQLCESWLRTI